jgi:tripartite-type tricarboxylate transporter receptor subunit TctC
MTLLQDKVAFVTGGSAGIGRGIVEAYLSEGARVVIGSRNPDAFHKLADELHAGEDRLRFVQTDATQQADVEHLVDRTHSYWERLDIAVLNAGGTQRSAPIARMTDEVGVVVVPASSDIQDIKDFLEALKANPGAMSVAGGSAGGTDHITLGLILKALGRSAKDGSYVAFAGGGPAQAAILGAQVKAGISGWSEFAEQIKAGRMRALATTGETRTAPDVATLKEGGVDVVTSNWRGVFAPPGIRPDAREALVKLMTEIHALPAWKEILETRGWDDAFLTGDAFAQFLEKDRAQTEAVLKEVGLA